MKLLYLWIEDYKNIHKQGFNFSGEYEFKFDYDTNKLTCEKNEDYIPNFFGDNIDITAIVGKNGAGKSSVFKIILGIINQKSNEFKYSPHRKETFIKIKTNSFFLFKKSNLYYIVGVYDTTYCKSPISEIICLKQENIIIKEIKQIDFYNIYFNYMIDNLETNNDIINNMLYYKSDNYSVPILLEPDKKNKKIEIRILDISINNQIIRNYKNAEIKNDFIVNEIFNPNYIDFKLNSGKILNKMTVFTSILDSEKNKRKIILQFKKFYNDGDYKKINNFYLFYKLIYKFDIKKDKNIKEILKKIELVLKKQLTELDDILYLKLDNSIFDLINNFILKFNMLKMINILYKDIVLDNDLIYVWENIIDRIKNNNKSLFGLNNMFEEYILTIKDNKLKKIIYNNKKVYKELFTFKYLKIMKSLELFYKDKIILPTKNLILIKDSQNMLEFLPPWIEIEFYEDEKSFSSLSSGEKTIFRFLMNILYHLQNLKDTDYNTLNLFLDETELGLHPDWQKRYIKLIINTLNKYLENINKIRDKNNNFKINITFATHSPFILSDIPKSNIIFLDKYNKDEGEQKKGNCKVLHGNALEKVTDTFGANIHTLLSDSFFMEDGTMGEFAKGKINEIIKFYREVKDKEKNNSIDDTIKEEYSNKKNNFEKLQKIIGEPYLKTIIKNHLEEIEIILYGKEEFKKRKVEKLAKELGKEEIEKILEGMKDD